VKTRMVLALACALMLLATASAAAAAAVPQLFPQIARFDHVGARSIAASADGTTIALGTWEGAIVLTEPPAGWGSGTPQATPLASSATAEDFGESVSISADGRTVVVGSQEGVHLYERPDDGWGGDELHETAMLSADGVSYFASVGVAISGDGTTVSAFGDGESYVYERPAGGWETTAEPLADFPDGGAFNDAVLSYDGSVLATGAPAAAGDPGGVFVYARPAGGWRTASDFATTRLRLRLGAEESSLGWKVAMSADGATIAGSAPFDDGLAPYAGAVYVWADWRSSAAPSARLVNADAPTAFADLGQYDVAIAGDGGLVAATTLGVNEAPGIVHVFSRPAAGWSGDVSPLTRLVPDDQADDDGFGWALDFVDGDGNLVASSPGDYPYGVPDSGVYVFAGDEQAPSTAVTTALGAPDGTNGWFSSPVRVSIAGDDGALGSGVAEVRCAVDPLAVPLTFMELPAGPCPHLVDGVLLGASGTHAVYAAGVDHMGNVGALAQTTFKLDAVAPQVIVPPDVQLAADGHGDGVALTYTHTVSDDLDPAPATVCAPASGSRFAVGVTEVACTATDAAGNSTRAAFSVTVIGPGGVPVGGVPVGGGPDSDGSGGGAPNGPDVTAPRQAELRITGVSLTRRTVRVRASRSAMLRATVERCRRVTARRGGRSRLTCAAVARVRTARPRARARIALPRALPPGLYRVTARAVADGIRSSTRTSIVALA
jgi:hypothetical protein